VQSDEAISESAAVFSLIGVSLFQRFNEDTEINYSNLFDTHISAEF